MAKQPTKQVKAPEVKTFAKTEANRVARLKRHLKRHENDKQAQKALGSPAPIRKKPIVKGQAALRAKKEALVPHKNATLSKRDVDVASFVFGSVKPNIFGVSYDKENVRAICYGLNIKFTGAKKAPTRKR